MPSTPGSRYVESPADYDGDELTLFVAGGITGTIDWQSQVRQALAAEPVVVLNPRRAHFGIDHDLAHHHQVSWEHRYLHDPEHRADVVLMWFAESNDPHIVQPIALYELGRLIERGTALAVGADPKYARRRDILVQLELAALHLTVHDTLTETIMQARRLLLPQQLWRICVDLTTQLLPALGSGDAARHWPGDPAATAAHITTLLGRFDEPEPQLAEPLRQLRQALTDTPASAADWTTIHISNLTHAIEQFTTTASAVGEFGSLWPYSPAAV